MDLFKQSPIQFPVGRDAPYSELSKLIDTPVLKTPAGYWLISSYQGCRQVSMDQTNLSVKCRNSIVPHLLGMDPPEHLFARKRAASLFSKTTIQSLSRFSHDYTEMTCSRIKNTRVDFVETLAFAIPARTIGFFLGVDETEQAQFNKWVQWLMLAPALTQANIVSHARAEKVNQEIDRFFVKKVEHYIQNPGGSPPFVSGVLKVV